MFSYESYRAEEAGREGFVGGLVEAADGGDRVFLAGLDITDHPVAPDIGYLDFQEVVSIFEEWLDVGGSERGFPEDTCGNAIDGNVSDVLDCTEIHEDSCAGCQLGGVDRHRCLVNGSAGEVFHGRIFFSCPRLQFRKFFIGGAAVLLVEMHLPGGGDGLDYGCYRCLVCEYGRFGRLCDRSVTVTELVEETELADGIRMTNHNRIRCMKRYRIRCVDKDRVHCYIDLRPA